MGATRRRVTRGVKGAASKATDTTEQVRRTGEEAGASATQATDAVTAEGLFDRTERGEGVADEQTIRQELAAIVREAAVEVLAPVARQVTTYAAKYAVKRGPTLAQKALMPRIRDTLDSVADAGGAGAFARDAFGSVSGSGGGVLARLGAGDVEENGRRTWQQAKAPIEEHVDVAIPLQHAFELFGQFARHISFMSDLEQVEEVPNERIVWDSTNGLGSICVITFHELSDHLTRVMVTYEPHPHGLQKASSVLRSPRRAMRNDLMHFKSLVEVHPDDVDALYEESKEPGAEEDFEPEEDNAAAEDQWPEGEDAEPEVDEREQPTAKPRSRARSARSAREMPAGKASDEPRKRAVRSGSKAPSSGRSGSGSSSGGGRRQAQPAAKSRGRSRAKS